MFDTQYCPPPQSQDKEGRAVHAVLYQSETNAELLNY